MIHTTLHQPRGKTTREILNELRTVKTSHVASWDNSLFRKGLSEADATPLSILADNSLRSTPAEAIGFHPISQ